MLSKTVLFCHTTFVKGNIPNPINRKKELASTYLKKNTQLSWASNWQFKVHLEIIQRAFQSDTNLSQLRENLHNCLTLQSKHLHGKIYQFSSRRANEWKANSAKLFLARPCRLAIFDMYTYKQVKLRETANVIWNARTKFIPDKIRFDVRQAGILSVIRDDLIWQLQNWMEQSRYGVVAFSISIYSRENFRSVVCR